MMKIFTRNDLAKDVYKRWVQTYGTEKASITKKLKALKNPTHQEVDAIIGNDSWTDIKCNECGKYVDIGIELGEEPDYESSTAIICDKCLIKAYQLMNKRLNEDSNDKTM